MKYPFPHNIPYSLVGRQCENKQQTRFGLSQVYRFSIYV
jgi:hypothetical protein